MPERIKIREKSVPCGVANIRANLTSKVREVMYGVYTLPDWRCATLCRNYPCDKKTGGRESRKPKLGMIRKGEFRGHHGVVDCLPHHPQPVATRRDVQS